MDDDQQSPEEFEAHFDEAGPVAAATRWLRVVLDEGDLEAAWPLTDPVFRLVLAQAWIWSNRDKPTVRPHDRDQLAADFSSETPSHPLWPLFAEITLAEIRAGFPEVETASLGAASRPRLVSPGYEAVLIIPTGPEGFTWMPGTAVLNQRMLLHSTSSGWLVAGIGDFDPVPGWPPVRRPVS